MKIIFALLFLVGMVAIGIFYYQSSKSSAEKIVKTIIGKKKEKK